MLFLAFKPILSIVFLPFWPNAIIITCRKTALLSTYNWICPQITTATYNVPIFNCVSFQYISGCHKSYETMFVFLGSIFDLWNVHIYLITLSTLERLREMNYLSIIVGGFFLLFLGWLEVNLYMTTHYTDLCKKKKKIPKLNFMLWSDRDVW